MHIYLPAELRFLCQGGFLIGKLIHDGQQRAMSWTVHLSLYRLDGLLMCCKGPRVASLLGSVAQICTLAEALFRNPT